MRVGHFESVPSLWQHHHLWGQTTCPLVSVPHFLASCVTLNKLSFSDFFLNYGKIHITYNLLS